MPTIYVLSKNMKNIRVFFLSETVQFLEVIFFSIYLNRRVFVMYIKSFRIYLSPLVCFLTLRLKFGAIYRSPKYAIR